MLVKVLSFVVQSVFIVELFNLFIRDSTHELAHRRPLIASFTRDCVPYQK